MTNMYIYFTCRPIIKIQHQHQILLKSVRIRSKIFFVSEKLVYSMNNNLKYTTNGEDDLITYYGLLQ